MSGVSLHSLKSPKGSSHRKMRVDAGVAPARERLRAVDIKPDGSFGHKHKAAFEGGDAPARRIERFNSCRNRIVLCRFP